MGPVGQISCSAADQISVLLVQRQISGVGLARYLPLQSQIPCPGLARYLSRGPRPDIWCLLLADILWLVGTRARYLGPIAPDNLAEAAPTRYLPPKSDQILGKIWYVQQISASLGRYLVCE